MDGSSPNNPINLDNFLESYSQDNIDFNSLHTSQTHNFTEYGPDYDNFTEYGSDHDNFATTEENVPLMKKKNFSLEKKRSILQMLLKESKDGKLKRGTIAKVANNFSACPRSIYRIWKEGKNFDATNEEILDFSSKLVKTVGRKRSEINLERIKEIPFRRRTTIRCLSEALEVPKSTLHRRVKEGHIRAHSNHVKPLLTDNNKRTRLAFCLSMIDEASPLSRPSFVNMYNYVHIDEKWFCMSKASQRYYLLPDEKEPLRACKSKTFIPKLMFLTAVARPRFDEISNEEFDGKIGIWAIVVKEPAKRSSKNRVAGTLETKPVSSVTKEVIRKYLIEKVLPAIREKWPPSSSKTIFIQQDNAKPHLSINDVEFVEAASKDGFDIRLFCQPPNSPDMNVLDLGFFKSIDSLQHKEAASTIDDFIFAVEKAFEVYPKEELNNIFLTLQSCMVEVMKIFGCNDYKIPHMNKKKLIRNGQLPTCIECDVQVLDEAKAALLCTTSQN